MMLAVMVLISGKAQAFSEDDATVDSATSMAQSKMLAEAQRQVPLPSIHNWQEKRNLKLVYELRDTAIATFTYLPNPNGACLMFMGPSVGYGMPYATQYTSPTTYGRLDNPNDDFPRSYGTKPQAEPNGLFMPSDAHGTWILMLDPVNKETMPQYFEPDVIVLTFRAKDRECTK